MRLYQLPEMLGGVSEPWIQQHVAGKLHPMHRSFAWQLLGGEQRLYVQSGGMPAKHSSAGSVLHQQHQSTGLLSDGDVWRDVPSRPIRTRVRRDIQRHLCSLS